MRAMNGRGLRLAIVTILSSQALIACGPRVIVVPTKPPAELMSCADEPAIPELPPPGIERDRVVLALILALRASGGDCRAKVLGTRAWADALPESR